MGTKIPGQGRGMLASLMRRTFIVKSLAFWLSFINLSNVVNNIFLHVKSYGNIRFWLQLKVRMAWHALGYFFQFLGMGFFCLGAFNLNKPGLNVMFFLQYNSIVWIFLISMKHPPVFLPGKFVLYRRKKKACKNPTHFLLWIIRLWCHYPRNVSAAKHFLYVSHYSTE